MVEKIVLPRPLPMVAIVFGEVHLPSKVFNTLP